MPYQITWREKGIHWQFYGDVTGQEIFEANEEFYSDARSDSAEFQIIDAREVSSLEWEEKKIKEISAQDKGASHFIKDLKVAYVSDKAEIISKLEKYIEVSKKLNSSWKFRGFRDLETAKKWVEE